MFFRNLALGLFSLSTAVETLKIHPYAKRYVNQEFPQVSPDVIRRSLSNSSISHSRSCEMGPGWGRPAGIGIEANLLPGIPGISKRDDDEPEWIEPEEFKDDPVEFFHQLQDPKMAKALAIDPSSVQLEKWKIDGVPVSTTGEWVKFDKENYGRWYLGGFLAGCTMTFIVTEEGFWAGHIWESSKWYPQVGKKKKRNKDFLKNMSGAFSYQTYEQYKAAKDDPDDITKPFERTYRDFKEFVRLAVEIQNEETPPDERANRPSFFGLRDVEEKLGVSFNTVFGDPTKVRGVIITKAKGGKDNSPKYPEHARSLVRDGYRPVVGRAASLQTVTYIGNPDEYPEDPHLPDDLQGTMGIQYNPDYKTVGCDHYAKFAVWLETQKEPVLEKIWQVEPPKKNQKRDNPFCPVPSFYTVTSTITAAITQSPTASMNGGPSKANVGPSLTGEALATSVSSALASLCPTPTEEGASTSCQTDPVSIAAVPILRGHHLYPGKLTLQVLDHQYRETRVRDMLVEMVARAANASASGSSCQERSYMKLVEDDDSYVDHRWETRRDEFCNMNSFLEATYDAPYVIGQEDPEKMNLQTLFKFIRVEDEEEEGMGSFDCSDTVYLVGEAIAPFLRRSPQFVWAAELGLEFAQMVCDAEEEFG